jgi:hypothetical protein
VVRIATTRRITTRASATTAAIVLTRNPEVGKLYTIEELGKLAGLETNKENWKTEVCRWCERCIFHQAYIL